MEAPVDEPVDSTLVSVRQTLGQFLEELPNMERLLQLGDMNNTIDLTMDNCNESFALANKHLLTSSDHFDEVVEYKICTKKIDPQKMAKLIELGQQKKLKKYDEKMKRKSISLGYFLDTADPDDSSS